MKLLPRFLAYLEQARASTRFDELARNFQALAEDHGYSFVGIIDVARLNRSVRAAILFQTKSKSHVMEFEKRRTILNHPRLRWARTHDGPFMLDDVRREMEIDETSWNGSLPAYLQGRQSAMLPLHRDGALIWCVSCSGAKPDTSPLALSTLHTAAHFALARSEDCVDRRGGRVALSRREGECIRWVGAGKTDEEISEILHIAPRTVRFHVTNAKRKLGVGTRTQAVAARLQR